MTKQPIVDGYHRHAAMDSHGSVGCVIHLGVADYPSAAMDIEDDALNRPWRPDDPNSYLHAVCSNPSSFNAKTLPFQFFCAAYLGQTQQ